MKLVQVGAAGTYESSDLFVSIQPKDEGGINITLQSPVQKQFGEQIIKVINETLLNLGIKNALVNCTDNGALDCVIKARVECAAHRAAGISAGYKWEDILK